MKGKGKVPRHLYQQGDRDGWCAHCQLPKANRVHDLPPAPNVPARYEKEQR